MVLENLQDEECKFGSACESVSDRRSLYIGMRGYGIQAAQNRWMRAKQSFLNFGKIEDTGDDILRALASQSPIAHGFIELA